ncbi:glycosyltransferase family 2 protein [uncultured Rikenella sp.]|uniref:glycosyltransferase family 2 protein n=3 Tax=uncultured Rikenella sp. TaxID=368003 RepID=UPI00272CC909|nr:glycosyltransferase family 2 protein [uncultured Rikenella sp.]
MGVKITERLMGNTVSKSNEPLVSIIIPTYNVETYVGRCMDSVVGQTYSHLEILPVDDGSTDRCGEILDRYGKEDDRIRVIHQENKGRIAVRKTGIEQAKGDYLFFVDADDWIEPQAIEVLVERALETGADVTMGYHGNVGDDGNRQPSFFPCRTWVFGRDEYVREMMDCQISGSICTKLFKRGILTLEACDFPRKYSAAEDHVMNCGTFCRISKAAGVGEVLYNYYMRPDSICHTFVPRIGYYQELFVWAVQNMGSELAVRYEIEHRSFFLRIYLDIIFSELIQNGHTYVGTEPFELVRSECRNPSITGRLPWQYRLKARLVRHPRWLHFVVHMWRLLKKRNSWRLFIPVENP